MTHQIIPDSGTSDCPCTAPEPEKTSPTATTHSLHFGGDEAAAQILPLTHGQLHFTQAQNHCQRDFGL